MRTSMLIIIAAAALGAAWPQSASHDLRLGDLKAKYPQEAILDSVLCQRAREAPNHVLNQRPPIDPKTLLPDLNSLMEKSDDVVLALTLDYAQLVSPSGENPVMYFDVLVIRSWKGSHHAGDILTYGWPGGRILCDHGLVQIWPVGGPGEKGYFSYGGRALVLFLRQSKDQEEAQLIEGLRPAGGEGTQGIYPIQIPNTKNDLEDCNYLFVSGIANKNVQPCASYLETNRNPILVSLTHDPLHSKYDGIPASDFLRAVQSAAATGPVSMK